MLKAVLASALCAGTLALAACSERTEDAAENTLKAATADAEANAAVVSEKVESAAAEAAVAVDKTVGKADRAASRAEADVQDQSVEEAARD